MKLNGEGTIINGRELSAVTFDKDALVKTVQINTYGAWTARFVVEGAAMPGAKYQFTFDHVLPVGTKLTLRFGDDSPDYYYYFVEETDIITVSETERITVVDETKFFPMGTVPEDDQIPKTDLIPETNELLAHTLQLSADFATVAAFGGNVALSTKTGTTSYPIDSVGYTVNNAVVEAKCRADAQKVEYLLALNNDPRYSGKTIYLVAKLKQDDKLVSVPYDAKITWNGNEGTWLGGDTAYFVLGNFAAMDDDAEWALEGLYGGSYAITWYLTAAPAGTQNVFQDVLATSKTVTFSVPDVVKPSLEVTLESVNEKAPNGDVLTGSDAYVLVFRPVTNMTSVQARLEKQTALKIYSEVDNAVDDTTVTIPGESGVYRVRFSLDGFAQTSSDWDDVYFSFVVR